MNPLFRKFGRGGTVAEDDAGITGTTSRPAVATGLPQRRFANESHERFYEALAEIALAEEANEWARKRAAQALYVITDPPPQEAIDLGRRLAKRYGW